MIVACSLERIWIAQGARHRPERQNSQHGITLIVIDPFAWIEPVAHLSERKVCPRVKWISVTSRLSCRVFNPHFGIHTSEHSVNIRTNSAFEKFNKFHFTIIMSFVESTIRKRRKIRLSEKIGLRVTFAVGHTLFFIAWIKFEFFVIIWLRHVFTITFVIIRYKKIFQSILLSAQWIVIPPRMVVPAAWNEDELPRVQEIDLSGRAVSME